MAAGLLSWARSDARRRGAPVGRPTERRRTSMRRGSGIGEPVALTEAMEELISARRWESVTWHPAFQAWTETVGPDIATHLWPTTYDVATGTLSVRADSKAWATQMRLLAPHLVPRLNDAGSSYPVQTVQVLDPRSGPSRPALPLLPAAQRAPSPQGPARSGDPELESIRRRQSENSAAAAPARPVGPTQEARQRRVIRARALARARTRSAGSAPE